MSPVLPRTISKGQEREILAAELSMQETLGVDERTDEKVQKIVLASLLDL